MAEPLTEAELCRLGEALMRSLRAEVTAGRLEVMIILSSGPLIACSSNMSDDRKFSTVIQYFAGLSPEIRQHFNFEDPENDS